MPIYQPTSDKRTAMDETVNFFELEVCDQFEA